jgi:protein TonB
MTEAPASRHDATVRDATAPRATSDGGPKAKQRCGDASFARPLIIALVISLSLHVTAVLLLLHAGVPVADVPDKPTEVELVMEEHKGDLHPATSPPPSPPSPPAPQAEKPPPKEPELTHAQAARPPPKAPVQAQRVPEQTADADNASEPAPPAAAPPIEEAKHEPSPAPSSTAPPVPVAKQEPSAAPSSETPVQQATREAVPAPPATQPAPKITLEGTDSPSDARAFGDRIIPAAPNAVFHNRPPEYPEEAALNGERGTVVVIVHITPAGTAAGVDLVRSSGYELLDRAARQAVLRWRFLPAVKDGQPVASDMTMGFDFEND